MSNSTPASKAPAAKKSPVMLIVIVAVVVLGAAGGAWFFMRDRGPAPVVAKKLSEHGLVKFEPFVVNLADQGNQRFLRASIQLVVDSPEEAAEFAEKL